ncbi:MerR family transcriptional regulator [Streptomyces sp. NPDC014623]|uniref:helix-turn-helix domain-containing protein n=1 Tax=Streptomyces sp. NPDC014623 TaxID=3364875 RepID=UPI0036F798C8
MDGDALHPTGDLARRTGLTVKTVRFHSDAGGVLPAGNRLYDIGATSRLDLVRTLCCPGMTPAVIREILARELSVPDAAAAHADAPDVEIRTLCRAVPRAVARRGPATEGWSSCTNRRNSPDTSGGRWPTTSSTTPSAVSTPIPSSSLSRVRPCRSSPTPRRLRRWKPGPNSPSSAPRCDG